MALTDWHRYPAGLGSRNYFAMALTPLEPNLGAGITKSCANLTSDSSVSCSFIGTALLGPNRTARARYRAGRARLWYWRKGAG